MANGHAATASQDSDAPLVLHASCVTIDNRAVLILGASGQGKSGLALQLISLGARLVSDDRTCCIRRDGPDGPQVMAEAPDALRGMIEARGLGILRAEPTGPASIRLVVDLDQTEADRLPLARRFDLLGVDLPLVHMVDSPSFPAALMQYVRGGRVA